MINIKYKNQIKNIDELLEIAYLIETNTIYIHGFNVQNICDGIIIKQLNKLITNSNLVEFIKSDIFTTYAKNILNKNYSNYDHDNISNICILYKKIQTIFYELINNKDDINLCRKNIRIARLIKNIKDNEYIEIMYEYLNNLDNGFSYHNLSIVIIFILIIIVIIIVIFYNFKDRNKDRNKNRNNILYKKIHNKKRIDYRYGIFEKKMLNIN